MYKKILVPVDGSELAECVLPHVASIASGCEVLDVVFVRVVEPFMSHSGHYGEGLSEEVIKGIDADHRAAAEKYLSELVAKAAYGQATVQSALLTGQPAESIADYASKNAADLIVIATHGRSGITRWAWGSVADRLLRSSCVPVLMIRAPGCVPGIY